MSDILAERAARRRGAQSTPDEPVAQRKGPASPDMADLKSATEHFRQGVKYLKQQQLEKALRAFELASKAEPDNGSYRSHVIWTRHLTDELNAETAEARLREARKMQDGHGDAGVFLGKLVMQRGELSMAKGLFESVLKRNPRNVDAQRELRLVKMRIEQEAENETGLLGRLRRKLRGDS